MAKQSGEAVKNNALAETGIEAGSGREEVQSVSAGRVLSPVQRKAMELLARRRRGKRGWGERRSFAGCAKTPSLSPPTTCGTMS